MDIELANIKLNQLKKELDAAKKQYKDKTYGLNIIMKTSKTMEEELNEKRDILLKIQMQHKMTVVE